MSIYNILLAYGGKKIISLFISADTNNYDVKTNATAAGYVAGKSQINLTINSGVVVGSASAANPAINITGFTTGDVVLVNNNGRIQGAGGTGGSSPANAAGNAGGAGGTAVAVSYTSIINNYGIISGGGGGGGGADGYRNPDQGGWMWFQAGNSESRGGGGGGAGRIPGSGGSGNGAGGPGNLDAGGGPGTSGGSGGGPGIAGTSSGYGRAGGSAGNYIQGSSFVQWGYTGSRYGGSA